MFSFSTMVRSSLLVVIIIQVSRRPVDASCLFGTASDCEFQCHCAGGATCDPDTGVCPGECAQDSPGLFTWSGEACQIGNVARGKTTNQTGTYQVLYSDQAVDGLVIDGTHNDQRDVCAHPYAGDGNHSKWTVDLGGVYVIHNVTVFNTNDHGGYQWLVDFDVFVTGGPSGSHTCGYYTGTVPRANTTNAWRGTANISCDAHPVGRYVIIEKTGSNRPGVMTLCEVVVIGHKYHSCDGCQHCSEVIGCRSCSSPGLKKPPCTDACDVGTYGLNCAESCSGHCGPDNPYSCSPSDGSCPGGCQQWYTGTNCTVSITLPRDNGESMILGSVGSSSVVVAFEQNKDLPEGAETHYGYRISYRGPGSNFSDGPNVAHLSGQTLRAEIISGLNHNTHYEFILEQYRTWGDRREYGDTIQGPSVKTASIGDAKLATSPTIQPALLAVLGCVVVALVITLVVAVVRHRGCRGVFNPSPTKQRSTSVDTPPAEATRRSTAPPTESTVVRSEPAHQVDGGYENMGEKDPQYENPGSFYEDIRNADEINLQPVQGDQEV